MQAAENAVVIVEGMFLHRDELAGCWDYSCFLDVRLRRRHVECQYETEATRTLNISRCAGMWAANAAISRRLNLGIVQHR